MTNPDLTPAQKIHAQTLSDVVNRIAQVEKDYPPAVIPIVAANVAMASCLDQLLDLDWWSPAAMMREVIDVCDPGRTTTNREQP